MVLVLMEALEGFMDRTVLKTVMHGGGSIMVWRSMTAMGPGLICQVQGRMSTSTIKSWRRIRLVHLQNTTSIHCRLYFNMTTISSTRRNQSSLGLRINRFVSWNGQYNLPI
jgi:hypothetical protein